MKTNALGRICEKVVAKWLCQKGYTVLAKNYLVRGAEIDIIATNADTLIFVEVKSRHAGYNKEKFRRPAAAVTAIKQKRIVLAAGRFLSEYPSRKRKRFDVIEVIADEQPEYTSFEIKHIKSAFSAK